MILKPNDSRPHPGISRWPDDVPLPEGTDNGRRRLEIETHGPWFILKKVKGLAVRKLENGRYKIYGDRVLSSPKQEGYSVHGRVSIKGKRRDAFTSSMMVSHQGKLVEIAVLYVYRKTS